MSTFDLKFDKLSINIGALKLKDFENLARKELTDTNARLNKNINSGKDSHGKALKPYSASYKKQISKKGVRGGTNRKGASKASTKVNLTITGEMLRSKTVNKIPGGAELVFEGGHSNTKLSNEGLAKANMKTRPGWHEFDAKDLKRIDKSVEKLVEKQTKDLIKVKKNT